MKPVLIVDDEEAMTVFFARTLRRKGIEVLTADKGEDAIRLYAEHKPVCVFLDLHLPGMKGTEVLAKIKEIDPEACVYFVTGDPLFLEKRPAECASLGVRAWLAKPIDVESVIEIVKKETGVDT